MPPDRTKLLIAAGMLGVGVTVAASYYYFYSQQQRKKREETDEGIGDEDSIISDSEDPAILKDLTTPVTVAPRDSASNEFNFDAVPEEDIILEHDVAEVRRAYNLENQTDYKPVPVVEVKKEKTVTSEEEQIPESSENEEEKSKKVLILGLDRAGKTALIETLTNHQDRNPEKYTPTSGFNVAQARCDGVTMNIMEVGGNEATRQYWPNFLQNTDLLIYVIDGTDQDRFDEAKDTLTKILADELLADVPCLLLANKQDITGALSCEQIISEKDLAKISSKRDLKFTLLDSICIPDNSTIQYSDTLMAVILNLLG